MQRNFLKILIVIVSISLFIAFYLTSQNSNPLNDEDIIDLVGNNKLWNASLNIQLNYDSELRIKPRRDDFNIPPEINIELIVNGNSLYTNTLEYVPNKNNNILGTYMVVLDTDDYFNKDIDDVQLIIRYDNESSTLFLN